MYRDPSTSYASAPFSTSRARSVRIVLWFQSCVARSALMTSAAVQAPAAQIGSMTAHSASEICRPRAITTPPLATGVARLDYDCGYLSRGSDPGYRIGDNDR